MSFNPAVRHGRFFKVVLPALLLTSILFQGCKILEDPPAPSSFNSVGPAQPDCLSSLPDQIGDFFQGRMQEDQQIEAMCDCINSGLQTFMDMTRGSQAGVYKGTEIQGFFNRYFVTGQKISDGLTHEAMKLKSSLFGGDATDIPEQELLKVMEFVRVLKTHAPRFKKMMPLSGEHAAEMSEEEIAQGTRAIRAAAEAFGRFFTGNGNSYRFADAGKLLQELENSYPDAGGPTSGVRLLREQLPVFGLLKAMLLNSSKDEISNHEWSRFLSFGARIHATYLQWAKVHKVHDHDWMTPEGLDALEGIAAEALDLLAESALENTNGIVPSTLTLELVDLLREMKLQTGLGSHETTLRIANFVALGLIGKQVLFSGPGFEINFNLARPLKTFINMVKRPFYRVHERVVRANVREMTDSEFERLLVELDADVGVVTGAFESFRAAAPTDPDTMHDLIKFLDRISDLFEGAQDHQNFRDYLIAGFALKNFAIGRPYDSVSTQDWLKLVSRGQKLARVYLRSLRDVKYPDGLTRDQALLDHWWRISEAGLNALIEMASDRQPARGEGSTGEIEIAELLALLDRLPSSMRDDMFPEPGRFQQWRTLAAELGVMKAGLVGGSQGGLSAQDVESLLAVASVMKVHASDMMRHLPLSIDDIGNWSRSKVDDIAADLAEAGLSIGDAFRRLPRRGSLQVADLERLIDKAGFLLEQETADRVRQLIPVVGAAKAVIVRPPATAINSGDWVDLWRRLGRWGGWGLQFFHLIKEGKRISFGDTYNRFHPIIENVLNLLYDSTLNRNASSAAMEGHGILFTDMDRLFDSVYDFAARENAELPIRRETAKAFMRPLVRRIFGGMRWDETGRNANGIRSEAVVFMQRQFRWWQVTQSYLIQIYSSLSGNDPNIFTADGYNRDTLIGKIRELTDAVDRRADLSPTEKRLHRNVLANITSILRSLKPMFLGDEDYISFHYDNSREHLYSFHNMSAMNINWLLLSTFIQAYAEDRERALAGTGITVLELEHFVVDSFDAIKDLKFGNPNQTAQDLSAQRFQEANLFTQNANGDPYFGLMEGVEYLNILLSTKANTERVYADVLTVCPHGELDYAGKPKIEVECWRRRFFDRDRFHWYMSRNIPWMAWYYKGVMTEEERAEFQFDLESAARGAKGSDFNKPVDSAEAESFVMVPFYVEALFKRYDNNRTGILSIEEALQAYPVVCPIILNATNNQFPANCRLGESGLVESIFGYMLKYGNPPNMEGHSVWDDIGNFLNIIGWNVEWWMIKNVGDAFNMRFTVARGRIMNIVGALARLGNSDDESSNRPASTTSSSGSRAAQVDLPADIRNKVFEAETARIRAIGEQLRQQSSRRTD